MYVNRVREFLSNKVPDLLNFDKIYLKKSLFVFFFSKSQLFQEWQHRYLWWMNVYQEAGRQ